MDDYSGHEQNWAVLQDKNGMIYIGNNRFLLEYDGETWRRIKVPKDMAVRSLGIDALGRIYVGGQGDIGYLKTDEKGEMRYNSLLGLIDENDRDFYDIWDICCLNNEVYFRSFRKILRYSNDKIKTWTSQSDGFTFSCILGDRYYFQERPYGLFRMENDSVIQLSSFPYLKTNKIRCLIPVGESDEVLMSLDPYTGLMKFNLSHLNGTEDNIFSLFNTQAEGIFSEYVIYRGRKLKDGSIALGTLGGGVVIINGSGKLIRNINSASGLQNNRVHEIYQDIEGNLWMALNKGISRCDLSSRVTYWGKDHNYRNTGFGIARFNNITYIVGSDGLNYIQDNMIGEIKPAGEPVSGFCCLLFKIPFAGSDTILLIGSSAYGLSSLKNKELIQIHNFGATVYSLCQSIKNPNRLYVGTTTGLSTMLFKKGKWLFEGNVQGISGDIRSIQEDADGNIWLGTQLSGVIRIIVTNDILKPAKISHYYTTEGLPASVFYTIRTIKGCLAFLTEKGVFRFDPGREHFFSDCTILPFLCDSTTFVNDLNEDGKGNIWVSFGTIDSLTGSDRGYTGVIIPQGQDRYSWIDMPFRINTFSVMCMSFESERSIWMGGLEVYHFNGDLDLKVPLFRTVIRKVTGTEDTVIYHGYNSSASSTPLKKILRYKYNTLSFEYAALSYYKESDTQYQIWLEGFDKGWSKWTNESTITYNNLNERSYRFHVRARNIYDVIGEEDVFEFRIKPPWHRSLLAYAFYMATLIFLVYIIIQLYTRRLQNANIRLEKTVKERTLEIEKQRDVVISQKNHIEKINAEITDSIKYARYIQKSILPKEDQLASVLGEYFVLFKPKDIVSGDFYWVAKVEKTGIAAVADCTGHGVPGAFMSMLGAAFMNEIINKEYITHPGVILRRLRKEVIHSMKQRGDTGEQQDGMDIALCAIDHENMTLQFAGANNPLYLVRKNGLKPAGELRLKNEDYSLYEIKGDHMPIGIYYRMDNFTQHEIELLKGDVIYMFSDGLADQFGGPDTRKLGYKSFRENLLKSSSGSLSGQKEFLEKIHESWIGDNNQIDDITIVGFRI